MQELHERIIIGCNHSSIRGAEQELKAILKRLHLGSSHEHDILVAASEAINNAVTHGNKNDPTKQVSLDIDYRNHHVTLEVQDEGSGFDLQTLPDPLLPENLLKPSGRGIHIMKSLMDSVDFDFTPNGTRVIMESKTGKNRA
jgi:serine/threonine-protein kinase RsbW